MVLMLVQVDLVVSVECMFELALVLLVQEILMLNHQVLDLPLYLTLLP